VAGHNVAGPSNVSGRILNPDRKSMNSIVFREEILRSWVGVLVLVMLGGLAGCGSSETTSVKKDLSEEEKRQLQELNEQRASEWGTMPKRK